MGRRNVFPLLAASAILAVCAYSQTLPEGVRKVTTVEGITEYALPNGLHVLLFPDASKPKLTVNVTYLVGSRHEGYGESGMAHLLEHLLFLETRTRTSIKKELTDHGAQWNGTTSWDRTNYFETVTSTPENLKWAIELEADRMVNTKMEKSILDTEMTVVRNEFESGENSPDRMLFQRTFEAAYTFHAYSRTVIGSRSDIENVPIERLAAFYRKYYQPDNAVLTIAGSFDEAKTLGMVSAAFGGIPRPERKLERTYTVEPVQDGEREVTLRRVGDVQAILAAYHVPSETHPDYAPVTVLSVVLGDSPSGRLYKALVDNQKAVSAGMFVMGLHDPGLLVANARVRKDQSLEEARRLLIQTVEDVVKEPPSKEEVERAKTKIQKQIELSLADSQTVCLALSEALSVGDWRMLFYERDEIKQVTEQDVLRVAKAYLKSSNRTLGQFIPTASPDRAEIPANPDVAATMKDYKGSAAASEGEAFDPSPLNIEKRVTRLTLPNGMKVVLLPKKTRGGTVFASLTLRFGDEKSLFDQSAIAELTGGLLMRGTKSKSRQQIQDEMDRLKARMNVFGDATSAGARVETVEANLAGTLRLAAEILREPSFPENELATLRQQRIAGIESGKSEPRMLAPIELERHLFPFPHGDVRYVSNPNEQIEDLKKPTLGEVGKFHAKFYGASNAELAVVGQFDKDEIAKLVTELFGNWKSPSPYERVTRSYNKAEAVDRKIETPDKQNAVWMCGMPLKITDEDPDFPAMVLANYMFGGSGASRLFKRVRDKEGLSYGINSVLRAPTHENGGGFGVFAISAPQNTPKVEASVRDELSRTLKEGFSADEVESAKKSYLQESMVRRSQDRNLVQLLSARAEFDRTMQFDGSLESKVSALTADQINEAMRRHVDVSTLSIVKAGDFKKAGVLQ